MVNNVLKKILIWRPWSPAQPLYIFSLHVNLSIQQADSGGHVAAYLLGNFKVTNAEGFEKYRDLVTKTIRDHGGEYIAVDMNSIAVEGDAEHLSVVLKFANMEALRGWYDSPEYQEIHPLRTDNSEGTVTFATTGTAKND